MTGWFNPVLLAKLLLRVITSDVFGQYADRRLIEAALDPDKTGTTLDVSSSGTGENEPIWIDYAADLGDGFDATYAIAYLLAQPFLAIDDLKLPRGSALFLGGDEVYPTAERDAYILKLRKPYEFAWPAIPFSGGAVALPSVFAASRNTLVLLGFSPCCTDHSHRCADRCGDFRREPVPQLPISWAATTNDAFSAMALDSHRHFVRMHIKGDTLTLYPIAIDRVPARGEWGMNPKRGSAAPSVFMADPPLKFGLIEEPLVIRGVDAPSTEQIKPLPGSPG